MQGKRILLIVGGGIAAYKACELIRLIRKAGGSVRCVLTAGGAQFITPMTLAALSEQPVLPASGTSRTRPRWAISSCREADLVVVAPATADLLAKMAGGIADDLATTLLLATDKKVLAAPAMNVRMWQHEATKRNVARLRADGVTVLEPDEGEMACGEYGPGRLPEPEAIFAAIEDALGGPGPLAGRHVIVTAGPTHEPIDPVRVIANRSSGKQGFAIAGALAELGARVTLVAGPVSLDTPAGVGPDRRRDGAADGRRGRGRSARRCRGAGRGGRRLAGRAGARDKLKKEDGPPALDWQRTPDILANLAASAARPRCWSASRPRPRTSPPKPPPSATRKGADWIVANDVSGDVMGGDDNTVHLIGPDGAESWEHMSKAEVARRLAAAHRRGADMIEIRVKRLPHGEGLALPAYGSEHAVGLDVVSAEEVMLAPGARHPVRTGIAMAIPHGYEVQVRSRSGTAVRNGITCLTGTIDSDYRGELMVVLVNLGQEPFEIAPRRPHRPAHSGAGAAGRLRRGRRPGRDGARRSAASARPDGEPQRRTARPLRPPYRPQGDWRRRAAPACSPRPSRSSAPAGSGRPPSNIWPRPGSGRSG